MEGRTDGQGATLNAASYGRPDNNAVYMRGRSYTMEISRLVDTY